MKKNFSILTRKTAFSLIEMAIVILIIGVMVTGVIGGAAMIRSSTIAGARSLTAKSAVTKIDGLVAWYETSLTQSFKASEAYDGSQISTWYDVSPGTLAKRAYDAITTVPTNTLTKTAPASNVTYTGSGINNIPSLYFNGSGGIYIPNLYQGDLSTSTIFFVMQPTELPNHAGMIVDSGSSWITSLGTGYSNFEIHVGSLPLIHVNPNITVGKNYIGAWYFNGASSRVYVNNATSIVGSTFDLGTANAITGLAIGSDPSNNWNFNGLISEVIVYNRSLQLQERRDVMKYLSHKYNIPVTGI